MTMHSATRPPSVAIVWAVLIVATVASWILGAEEGVAPNSAVTLAVLAIAFLKVRLVGLHFMELREAPIALRAIFELWVVLSLSGLVITYLVVA